MTTATLTETQKPTAAEKRFEWPLCYEAENFILDRIDAFTERNSFARTLATRMRDETGTLILDWTDYLLLPASDESALRATGYTEDPLAGMDVTAKGFSGITRNILNLADKVCEGKVLFVLEGGYHLSGLQRCVIHVLDELTSNAHSRVDWKATPRFRLILETSGNTSTHIGSSSRNKMAGPP